MNFSCIKTVHTANSTTIKIELKMSKKIAIVYGTNKGNTKGVAEKIAAKLKDATVLNISDIHVADLAPYDYLILATSTIGHGDLIKPWKEKVEELKNFDFSGKTVALVGLGNSKYHGDTFAQGVSHLYKLLKDKVKIEGATSPEGYTFETTESLIDGKFVGLIIDQDNESGKTEGRIDAFLKALSI